MKKFILSLGLVAMMLNLTNCAQYEDVNPTVEPQGDFELFASVSRTANDGLNTVWKAGDNLTVFHAEAGATTYVYDAEFKLESAETGRFTGTLKSALTAEAYDWYAIYPHSSYHSSKTPEFTAYTPIGCSQNSTQTQNGNNSMAHIAGSNYPLVGVAKGVANGTAPAVAMTNVASLLKVVVTNSLEEPITVTDVAFTAPAEIVGTFNINFAGDNISATSSGDSFTDDIARLKVNKGAAIAKGETAEFYLAVAPFTAVANSELKIAVTALSETNDKGVHEKSITLSKDVTFASGKIKTLEVNYNTPIVAEVLPSVSTLETSYSVGFESAEGFVASSTYNNATEVLTGAEGMQWATFYGTPATTDKISGEQSMHMRWYTSAVANLGYTYTNFTISDVKNISFKSTATNGLKVKLSYKVAGADWVDVETFTPSTNATTYTHTFDAVIKNAQYKFSVVLPATNPSGTSRLRIDDVTFASETSVPAPVLNVTTKTVDVVADGGNGTIEYSVANPVEGVNVVASTTADWINNFDYSVAGEVSFTVAKNTENRNREATITLAYEGAVSATATVKQDAGESADGRVTYTENFTTWTNNTTSNSGTGTTIGDACSWDWVGASKQYWSNVSSGSSLTNAITLLKPGSEDGTYVLSEVLEGGIKSLEVTAISNNTGTGVNVYVINVATGTTHKLGTVNTTTKKKDFTGQYDLTSLGITGQYQIKIANKSTAAYCCIGGVTWSN